MEAFVMVVCVGITIGAYFVGYYKGKADSWGDAYTKGEKAGWCQAMRRQL